MCRGTWSFCDGNCDKCRTIATASTIDVREVARGKNIGGGAFECSVCGFRDNYHDYEVNYCPNCGADMRGEEDDTN